jgi:hypothetical protein
LHRHSVGGSDQPRRVSRHGLRFRNRLEGAATRDAPALLRLPRCDSDAARAPSDGKPRCADIVPMHRMRRVRPSGGSVKREATKIDGFRDASPGRPAATQQR